MKSGTVNNLKVRTEVACKASLGRWFHTAWDWTGDHRVMEEASTDILVDEDIFFHWV